MSSTIFPPGATLGILILGIIIGLVISRVISQQSGTDTNAVTLAVLQATAEQAHQERDTFLSLADQRFIPLDRDIQRLRENIDRLEQDRSEQYGKIATSLASVSEQYIRIGDATTKVSERAESLASALKNPTVRGRWGEIQLRRVVELAGMTAWCDFDEQKGLDEGDGRPDMTIKLPDNQCIFVDAKTPLAAYLALIDERDERQQAILRTDHAMAVKAHVLNLAKRHYADETKSVDFVVMFVPGESFLQMALMEQPDLIEFAANKNVYLCGPLTLMPLLKSYALGWREKQQDLQAREIAKLGADLYDRLRVFTKHLAGVGAALSQATTKYNDAVGSFESRLLPQGRRIRELGALNSDEVESPGHIDTAPRSLTTGEDSSIDQA